MLYECTYDLCLSANKFNTNLKKFRIFFLQKFGEVSSLLTGATNENGRGGGGVL